MIQIDATVAMSKYVRSVAELTVVDRKLSPGLLQYIQRHERNGSSLDFAIWDTQRWIGSQPQLTLRSPSAGKPSLLATQLRIMSEDLQSNLMEFERDILRNAADRIESTASQGVPT